MTSFTDREIGLVSSIKSLRSGRTVRVIALASALTLIAGVGVAYALTRGRKTVTGLSVAPADASVGTQLLLTGADADLVVIVGESDAHLFWWKMPPAGAFSYPIDTSGWIGETYLVYAFNGNSYLSAPLTLH